MAVDSTAGKATNLSADKVDGKDTSLWAVVDLDGTVKRSNGSASSTRNSTGFYTIVFDRDVSKCAYTATLGGSAFFFGDDGIVQVANGDTNAKAVVVRTHDLSGTPEDIPFHLVVNC